MNDPSVWGDLRSRYESRRPRCLLALDGGGIRGVMTLGILKRIEEAVGQPLWQYFDYIAGTSTGAIIAAALARGLTVDELLAFYQSAGPEMFARTRFLARLNSLYRNGPLENKLKEVFGEATDLTPGNLKTLLLVVTRNVTTDSPWPISSNPEARYNARSLDDCNLSIPLWKLVRASTAAPIFFPPEVVELVPGNEQKTFVFVDGGMTPYNNPAFLLYRFATVPAYNLNWETGEDKLLLVSVGTGAAATLGATADDPESNMLSTGIGLPSTLMYASSVDQDINCRAIGRCTYGAPIDSELDDMIPRDRNGDVVPLARDCGRSFLYVRYNIDLSAAGLASLGFSGEDADPKRAQRMDKATAEHIDLLWRIGQAAGRQVQREHFGRFLPVAAQA
ncbi:MAG TPA: patatin-like phospholipase family protein [Vicinamibacterales bacterium]|nr:patatin-like phospholipase family protein [Vicinamibacterales bacterium]